METMTTTSPQTAATRPRILVVDDEPSVVGVVDDVVSASIDCQVIRAANCAEARKILQRQGVELLVADHHLPDGQGTQLLADLRQYQPAASAILMTGSPSLNLAVEAIRGGAVDFLAKPFNTEQLMKRVEQALAAQAVSARKERRLLKLKDAVRRLNAARRTVSKKVDLLCNDLITAYGELSRQLETIRTQESFRKTLTEAKDLEQLLCHAMDWLLRQLGYSNVAIWLSGDEGEFQLGAYMKYTVPGEPNLTDALRQHVVPLINREAFLQMRVEELKDRLPIDTQKTLAGSNIIGVSCTYLGEVLATVALFRDGKMPFTEEDAATLKLISPVFATLLASSVKGVDDEDDDGSLLDDDADAPKNGKKSDADWWKRGEEPPF